MTASDLGLRAAASLEASVGSYIALAAYRRLFTSDAAVREGAIVGAVRCAMDLDDEPALLACAEAWRTQPRSGVMMVEAACALLARGRSSAARELAAAERQRSNAPRAAYIEARARDAHAPSSADESDALGRWWHVHRTAVAGEDALVVAFAAARYAGLAFARCTREPTFVLPRADIASVCEVADDALLGERESRLPLLRGKLLSPSRFKRASALSSLEAIARRGGPSGVRAIALVVRHVDSLPTRLHPLELDRVKACLKHVEDPGQRERLLAALEGGAHEAGTSKPEVGSAEIATETSRLGPDWPVPTRLTRAALELLYAASAEDREIGASFLDAVMRRTTTLPPCSLSLLGAKLLSLGFTETALLVFDEALRLREPEARRWRGFVLRERAYEAVSRGDLDAAWSELSAARAILAGPFRSEAEEQQARMTRA